MNSLEMFVVLIIISTVSLLSVSNINYVNISSQSEIDTFISNYNLLRLNSINNKNCNVSFTNSKYSLKCKKINLTYNFKNDVTISTNYNDNKINFNEVGNISRSGTINFKFKDRTYIFTTSIMSGALSEK